MTMPTLLMQRAHDEAMGNDAPRLPDKPQRRSFTAEYKLKIVAEYDACAGDGDKGALLRREGLYSSHIVEWRRARDTGAISGLAAKHRKKRSDAERELEKAKKKIERLEDRLDRHRKALEAQGKASELLARLAAESEDDETRQQP